MTTHEEKFAAVGRSLDELSAREAKLREAIDGISRDLANTRAAFDALPLPPVDTPAPLPETPGKLPVRRITSKQVKNASASNLALVNTDHYPIHITD
ncbi:MAG: hypothetical protein ACIAXF_14210, partial [Phycisphaerales bacterium JB063]